MNPGTRCCSFPESCDVPRFLSYNSFSTFCYWGCSGSYEVKLSLELHKFEPNSSSTHSSPHTYFLWVFLVPVVSQISLVSIMECHESPWALTIDSRVSLYYLCSHDVPWNILRCQKTSSYIMMTPFMRSNEAWDAMGHHKTPRNTRTMTHISRHQEASWDAMRRRVTPWDLGCFSM